MTTLLLLAANPIDSEKLRIDEELREIRDSIAANPARPIKVEVRLAVRAQDLQKTLLELNPVMVHFTGHGDENGEILLENPNGYTEPVAAEALADLFRLFASTVKCVVLNACNSSEQASLLSKFIDSSIGMDGPISVGAGRAFSVSFYQALASGRDVVTAFELGRNQILLENGDEEHIPKLYFRSGIENVQLPEIVAPNSQSASGIELLIAAQLSLATATLGLTEKLALGPTLYDQDPPPVVEKCSRRHTTLTRILAELGERRWFSIHGGIGMGKTHLIVLLAGRLGARCVWIRLRDQTPRQALQIIDGTLSQILPRPSGKSRAAWYEACCRLIGRSSIIVLDDLPKTSGREELDDCMIFLSGAIHSSSQFLITIGSVSLPPPLRAAVGDKLFERITPPFELDEIGELLAAHEAPTKFLTNAWLEMVSILCRQHPLLLAEAAQFLERKAWKIDAGTFGEVMSGRYAINLDAPTQHDLVRTIPDADTRELLYRLRLVDGSFSDGDVHELGSIPKALEHNAERFFSLLGLWIQNQGQNRYVVSPLVARLKDSNLRKETERHIHAYLASRLVKTRPMTPLSVIQAVHHFVASGLYEDAGMLLLSALQAFSSQKKPKDDVLLSEVWSSRRVSTTLRHSEVKFSEYFRLRFGVC